MKLVFFDMFGGGHFGIGTLTVLSFPVLGPTAIAGFVAGNMMTHSSPRSLMVNDNLLYVLYTYVLHDSKV